ncbi:unnamed protein product [Prunus armeniaca]|uniref:Uncharacterized protein n=1 Tax=Prunus armeniaca TaxID=36596 RepID=A0A6J5URR0_PRUAR|nr:unnamed protein product [Prunus armeniaca]
MLHCLDDDVLVDLPFNQFKIKNSKQPTLAPNPTACTLLTYLFLQIHSLAAAHSGAGKVKVALAAIVANHLVVNLTLSVEGAIEVASRVRNTETERPVLLGSND